MKLISIILVPLSLLLLFTISGCYYDNQEELYAGGNTTCSDTTNVSYKNMISQILINNCNGCHNGSLAPPNLIFGNYVSDTTNIAIISNAIHHKGNIPPMPPGTSLSSCDLKKIDIWIRNKMSLN